MEQVFDRCKEQADAKNEDWQELDAFGNFPQCTPEDAGAEPDEPFTGEGFPFCDRTPEEKVDLTPTCACCGKLEHEVGPLIYRATWTGLVCPTC